MATSKRVVSLISPLLMMLALGEGVTATGLSPLEEEEILQWHNQQRSSVSPPATNMLEMVWSEELALIARNYSQTCPQNEIINSSLQSFPNTTIGENVLIVNSSELERSSYNHLLQMRWADSVQLAPNNCTGGSCKEYIQVVWALSQFIGCGASLCGDRNETVVIVCDYEPGPSALELEVYTAPYATGAMRCSECPPRAPDCRNNSLCYAAIHPQFNSSSSASPLSVTYTPTTTSSITSVSSTPLSSPTLFTSRGSPTASETIRTNSPPTTIPAVLSPQSSIDIFFASSVNVLTLLNTTGDVSAVLTTTVMALTPVTSTPTPVAPTPVTSTATPMASTPVTSTATPMAPTPVTSTATPMASTPVTSTATPMAPTPVTSTPTPMASTPVTSTPTPMASTPVTSTATPMASTPVTSTMDPQISPNVTQQTVTVTVTDYQFCSCNYEFGSGTEIEPCPRADRLPTLYVILIGVIPSIVAIALIFLLIIVVCTNWKRRKQVIKQTNLPRPRRPMRVRDSGTAVQPEGLTSVQLRHVSPLNSQTPSNSADIDLPLLPDPPSPYFVDDNPVRGNTFRLMIPNASYYDSSYTGTPAARDRLNEEIVRQPMVGLEAIREREDEREGMERGGVADIIARMERKQGRIVTTDC